MLSKQTIPTFCGLNSNQFLPSPVSEGWGVMTLGCTGSHVPGLVCSPGTFSQGRGQGIRHQVEAHKVTWPRLRPGSSTSFYWPNQSVQLKPKSRGRKMCSTSTEEIQGHMTERVGTRWGKRWGQCNLILQSNNAMFLGQTHFPHNAY